MMLLNDKLAIAIMEAGEALPKGGRSIKSFRNIQKFFRRNKDEIHKDGQDENIRFLVFFLDVFINKVIYNLAGELPDVVPLTGDVQLAFNRRMGDILNTLGSLVQKNQTEKFCECYRQMGIAYLCAVDDLNRGLKGG